MDTAKKVKALSNMDTCIRMLSDEESGIFEGWISLWVPDEATTQDLIDIVESDPEFYNGCCEYFARHISKCLVEGDWNKEGFSLEFYNRNFNKRLKG